MANIAVCQICNQTEEWHEEHGVKHAFSPDSTRFKLAEPKQTKITLPGDPILRMILVRKGIVTPEELASVEKELQSAGIITSERVGEPRSDSEPVSPSRIRNAERGVRDSIARGAAEGGAVKK